MRTFAAVSLFSALSAWAQVEKATMRTTGISCGVCAAVSEFKFRRMAGVDNVTISLASESITLAYKPDAAFSPGEIRQTLEPLDVHVVVFHVTARGRIQEHGGRKLFVAGKDTFVLQADKTAVLPAGTLLRIEGMLDDRVQPMQLKVVAFRPLRE